MSSRVGRASQATGTATGCRNAPSPRKQMKSTTRTTTRTAAAAARARAAKTNPSQYVLREAHCDDDVNSEGGHNGATSDEEDTDLSGFIVDDDAELSYYESDDEEEGTTNTGSGSTRTTQVVSGRRRRLCRGSPKKHLALLPTEPSRTAGCIDLTGDDEDDEISSALANMKIGSAENNQNTSNHSHGGLEVIDLTSSPVRNAPDLSDPFGPDSASNLVRDLSQKLKLSPSPLDPATGPQEENVKGLESWDSDEGNKIGAWDRPRTPTSSLPPRSPTKLKSPSKALSPSKGDGDDKSSITACRAPHRQSTDEFWDLSTINTWNDITSPKKTPTASPSKNRRAHFRIWSDDYGDCEENDDYDDESNDNSVPSPMKSPMKQKHSCKSPEKEEKRRIAEGKKAEKVRKAAFEAAKRGLAQDLFDELDASITEGKIAKLASSTGGVKIEWSKTLRSTAGRANWRRSVTKRNLGSTATPKTQGSLEDNSEEEDWKQEQLQEIKVEHFASIELAEKVIDCEERLVNTLAHEYCHLANFMVSNISDQPHGASFKRWAAKVTQHLQRSDNEVWKQVKVTTKHGYDIRHKYLWLCVGQQQQPKTKAMGFLNLKEEEGEEGCGAEYGRHSKSIDPERSRCGRCKGRLVQVRPKPRMKRVPSS